MLLVGSIRNSEFGSDLSIVSSISSINYNTRKLVSLAGCVRMYELGGDFSLYVRCKTFPSIGSVLMLSVNASNSGMRQPSTLSNGNRKDDNSGSMSLNTDFAVSCVKRSMSLLVVAEVDRASWYMAINVDVSSDSN